MAPARPDSWPLHSLSFFSLFHQPGRSSPPHHCSPPGWMRGGAATPPACQGCVWRVCVAEWYVPVLGTAPVLALVLTACLHPSPPPSSCHDIVLPAWKPPPLPPPGPGPPPPPILPPPHNLQFSLPRPFLRLRQWNPPCRKFRCFSPLQGFFLLGMDKEGSSGGGGGRWENFRLETSANIEQSAAFEASHCPNC